MILKEISRLDTVQAGVPDDLFIGCVSFEERCRKALVSGTDYKARYIMLFFYPELGPREKHRVKIIAQSCSKQQMSGRKKVAESK